MYQVRCFSITALHSGGLAATEIGLDRRLDNLNDVQIHSAQVRILPFALTQRVSLQIRTNESRRRGHEVEDAKQSSSPRPCPKHQDQTKAKYDTACRFGTGKTCRPSQFRPSVRPKHQAHTYALSTCDPSPNSSCALPSS